MLALVVAPFDTLPAVQSFSAQRHSATLDTLYMTGTRSCLQALAYTGDLE